jgi:hypothetical protein
MRFFQGNSAVFNTAFLNHSRTAAASAENAETTDTGAGHAPPITKNGAAAPGSSLSMPVAPKVAIGPTVAQRSQGSFVKATTTPAQSGTPYGNTMVKYTPSPFKPS